MIDPKINEIFYTAAKYDFVNLDKLLLKSESFRFVQIIHYKENIRYSLPYPDLILYLQLSYSFIEKSLKYLLSIFNRNFTYEDFKKKFGHNLDKMTKELQKFIPDFMKNMSDKIKELFNQLLKLKFDSLRYLDEEINLNINFLDLKKLITYVNDILEKYRN
ncbi:MAG TPA: hypothetical protein PK771_06845, partial [Spirochaetota bacterium]|nr:hypothetical protein [Spirochaetota bacterium]